MFRKTRLESFSKVIRWNSRPYSSRPQKEAPNLWAFAAIGALGFGAFMYTANMQSGSPVSKNQFDRAGVTPVKEGVENIARKRLPDIIKPTFDSAEVAVIFVLGGPGVGKGTQCAKLVAERGFVHLSAGDLLRAEQQRKDSEYGDLIRTCIREGNIVPMEVTIALLENAMREHCSQSERRFLIDGFPRKMDQAIKFEQDVCRSRVVIFFECSQPTMMKRLLKRGESSGREDDNVDSIRKRFETFVTTSMPVVDYFAQQGKLLVVNCEDSVDAISSLVISKIDAVMST